jgi:hypothetical protein
MKRRKLLSLRGPLHLREFGAIQIGVIPTSNTHGRE